MKTVFRRLLGIGLLSGLLATALFSSGEATRAASFDGRDRVENTPIVQTVSASVTFTTLNTPIVVPVELINTRDDRS